MVSTKRIVGMFFIEEMTKERTREREGEEEEKKRRRRTFFIYLEFI
jgi:hypothetical protein